MWVESYSYLLKNCSLDIATAILLAGDHDRLRHDRTARAQRNLVPAGGQPRGFNLHSMESGLLWFVDAYQHRATHCIGQ